MSRGLDRSVGEEAGAADVAGPVAQAVLHLPAGEIVFELEGVLVELDVGAAGQVEIVGPRLLRKVKWLVSGPAKVP
uniref:Uncharacterized protein n=1 Tax=Phenylobacterium glaciei TaxID=2803784 RepID=A0A974P745_9CAUL|nr:hypothetical protein JKL49_12010 [Phenylobacterium glaciei]